MNEENERFIVTIALLNTTPGARGVDFHLEDIPASGWIVTAEFGFRFYLRSPSAEDTFDTWYPECLKLMGAYQRHLWGKIQEKAP